MSDFQGSQRIRIQPNTHNYPLRFTFPVASTPGGSGAVPYGNYISAAQIKAYDPTGKDVSADMVGNVSVVNPNIVNCTLSYFPGAIEGYYKLTVILTFSSGEYTDEFDAIRRIVVKDI